MICKNHFMMLSFICLNTQLSKMIGGMNNTYLNGLDFNVGIYIRLSQEDKDKKYESDSESVNNQKGLLRNYVKSNNFNLVREYVDDGFSGTDF